MKKPVYLWVNWHVIDNCYPFIPFTKQNRDAIPNAMIGIHFQFSDCSIITENRIADVKKVPNRMKYTALVFEFIKFLLNVD
ncbi:MAG: hypothetical protein ACJA0U_002844 [Salibacteraceae bacterium]|jgi:hypothetical protein